MAAERLRHSTMADVRKPMWITWEKHRRTNELSRALGVRLFEILHDGNYVERALLLSLRTLLLLLRLRPQRVIVQNPSMVLAALVCFLKPILGYSAIVDRHSNFKFETSTSSRLKYKAFHYLSRYTVRRADLTIVTNSYLKELVEKWGGRGFVLQDKLPELSHAKSSRPLLIGKHNIAYVCSFSGDEPVDEVLAAAGRLDKSTTIYITGNYRRYFARARPTVSENVVLTGFLPENGFQHLLGAVDVIMALTKKEYILLCGAYEAVSLAKPLILSNTRCLRGYFGDAPVYTENRPGDIAAAIESAVQYEAAMGDRTRDLAHKLDASWTVRFDELRVLLSQLRPRQKWHGFCCRDR